MYDKLSKEQLKRLVMNQMPSKRWEHTLGVVKSSIELAVQFDVNSDQAELAAILHDYAKYWPMEAQQKIIEKEGRSIDLLQYDKQLWHAHVGAYVIEKDLGIEDQEILNAVRYHTSGREDMTLLDKVICLADYIEPGRNYPGVDTMRELAKASLEAALIAGLDSTISVLLKRKKRIYPLTIKARNDLILKLEKMQIGG